MLKLLQMHILPTEQPMAKNDFVAELRWRGMLHSLMPGAEEALKGEKLKGYIGFDPTASSLHVGNLAQIMTLIHFQKAGHKPYVLVGGATGMVGDPSGKSAERNLLDAKTLKYNQDCLQKQLSKFLNFDAIIENRAEMVNNYDWFKNLNFLDFIREAGKHITVNYLLAKDAIKNRLGGEQGLSFTEFSYSLIQGYDFYYLWKEKGVGLQMGGSDQWGNILTGTELIRRKGGANSLPAFGLTTNLIKKADGTKFGKSESGAVWLDPLQTSPYQFYQFWLNSSDTDAENLIKIFTLKTQEEIEKLVAEHAKAPHLRSLQKALAEDITIRVHSEQDYLQAINSTEFLFGTGSLLLLNDLTDFQLESIFTGMPQAKLDCKELKSGIPIVNLLHRMGVCASKTEAKKMLQGGGILINKVKITDANTEIGLSDLVKNRYIIVQKGKKNYYLLIAT